MKEHSYPFGKLNFFIVLNNDQTY